jgi:CPA2 family monovalent cation:H+ antiporter-2
MLFDPSVVVEQPWPLLGTVAIIIFGKSIVAYGIVRAFRFSNETALTVSASLAQIGEFSFILAGLGVGLKILPQEGRDLILAGAILSIFANPFIFTLMVGRAPLRRPFPAASPEGERGGNVSESGKAHTVLVGYGRVGKLVAQELRASGTSFSVVEYQEDIAQRAPDDLHVITGNAAIPAILEEAGLQKSDRLVIAIPGGFEAGGIAQIARELKPSIKMIARAHSDEEVAYLTRLGVKHVIMGEREIAAKMAILLTS